MCYSRMAKKTDKFYNQNALTKKIMVNVTYN